MVSRSSKNLLPMIRVDITPAAYDAIRSTQPGRGCVPVILQDSHVEATVLGPLKAAPRRLLDPFDTMRQPAAGIDGAPALAMVRAGASFDRPTIEVADILRRHGEAYLRDHVGHVGRTEQRAARIVDYPPDRCLHCRKPTIVGQKWVDVASGGALARFHQSCRTAWLAEQEVAARRALGMPE